MDRLAEQIVELVTKKGYKPLTPKGLLRALELPDASMREFRKALRELVKLGKIRYGNNTKILPPGSEAPTIGTFKRLSSGEGVVRIDTVVGQPPKEFFIPEHLALDAVTGDEVRLEVSPRTGKKGSEVVEVTRRATKQFVGTYFERDGERFVRVDGQIFSHSVLVADAGTKNARPQEKVVLEMLRFPTALERGEGVIVEVLGRSGDPRVDTLAVVRSLGIPDVFPEEVLEEARQQAATFQEDDLAGREDFTAQLTITIDPLDAKDFDDAVFLRRDSKTHHWLLTVHIADVAHFVSQGGALDRSARERGTSVYLPQQVIPMFPELISNGLASLQEGKMRYVKTAEMEFTEGGQRVGVRFANGAIRNKKRFTYEQVQAILTAPSGPEASATTPEIVAMLHQMHTFAQILRTRRQHRGSLELSMPETVLEYAVDGRVSGAHFAVHDGSHQLIEEFMLAANEAVAEHFHRHELPFLRRIHPAPDPKKLEAFAEFANTLKYRLPKRPSRSDLQNILQDSVDKPQRHAIHFALLRSLKQAVYTPDEDEHFALASEHYCHFTSPIRRYPDLMVHRMLGYWLAKKKAKASVEELVQLGNHCSKTERRAETAERDAVKMRLLVYMSERLGSVLPAVITGVAEYGFFAQGVEMPAEGLIHVSSLSDDYYDYDAEGHSLQGKRKGQRYRLGDRVTVEVARVDLQRRQLDFRVVRAVGKK